MGVWKSLGPPLLAAAFWAATTSPTMAQDESAADIAAAAAKQYAGVTLRVTYEAGLQPMDPKNFSGPLWEKLTGIKIEVVEMPTNEMFTKMMGEHQAGTGAYDVLNVMPQWLPDMVRAGALEPLDSYIDKYGYRGELDDIATAYRAQGTYEGKIYGFPDDGDVLLLYYRTDLFGDPGNQSEFKAKYGYDLAPPKDWNQFKEISAFFSEKGKGQNRYGSAYIHAPGLIHFVFEERFRSAGGKFFDAETMKATINNDIGVATLTDMVDQLANMPPGAAQWGPVEVLNSWLAGDLALMIWWPPPGRWSEGYGLDLEEFSWVPPTKVKGLVGYATTPSGHPELAAGFTLSVSAESKNKEAAYLFCQWMNSKEISLQRVTLPYALRDPFRISHYESAEYRNLWPSAGAYLDALKQGGENGLMDLSVIDTFRYEDALTRAITAALAGGDAKAALDKAAEEWDGITKEIDDDLGEGSQKAAYEAWASSPSAYPK